MPVLERSVAYGWPQGGGPFEWMDSAACADSSVELFFPVKGESYARAKSICGRCPVVEQCRAAIDWAERELKPSAVQGFYAGETPADRRRRRERAAR
jgi:WhiB family redox-sensing transcriptional regulator